MTIRLILRGLLVIVALLLVTYLLRDVLDESWIDMHVRGRGLEGELFFIGLCALLASIGFSRQIIAFLAGYGFGFQQGLLMAMLATVSGCIITFCIARLFLRSFLLKHYSKRIRWVDEFIRENTFTMTMSVRLLPLGSNLMFNLAGGVSGVRALPFFLGSALGYLPQMIIFSLLGGGARVDRVWQIAIAVTLFVIAALLGVYLYRKYTRYLPPEAGNDTLPG